MSRCILFPGVFQSNTSLPSYQFVRTIVESHKTTLVVNKSLDDDFSEIVTKADHVHEYEGSTLLYPAFCLWIFLRYAVAGEKFDIVATGQNCFGTFPGAILSVLPGTEWIVLGWDIPEGRLRVHEAFTPGITAERLFHRFNYLVLMGAYRFADATVLSDESSVVDTDQDSIIVAPGGVDNTLVETVRDEVSPESARERTEFVYVGHMHYHRGVDLILKAARELQSPARLTLIGHGPETAPPDDQQLLEKSLGTSFEEATDFDNENVECEYLGTLDHDEVIKRLLLSDVGICILPVERGLSHFHDAYALKTFEYMACSLAVISSRTDAAIDVLGDERQLVDNDVKKIREAMEKFCADDELVRELGERNAKQCEEYYWSTVRSDIENELDAILAD